MAKKGYIDPDHDGDNDINDPKDLMDAKMKGGNHMNNGMNMAGKTDQKFAPKAPKKKTSLLSIMKTLKKK